MRLYLKKRLLALLNSVGTAHEEIKREIRKKQHAVVLRLLEDCQGAAEGIGITLEQEPDENAAEIVRKLEDYCELLYQLGTLLETGTDVNKTIKHMQKLIIQISEQIRYQLREDRRQILFLPYKSSMWDSMESIWSAAEADPACDVSVVPIPYFDKQADGSLGAFHCEAAEFPDYVPVTDWSKVSLEERHPDIIYIHNPYDNNNRVTSVHPDFYCERIKAFTEMLVYVPYFICFDDVPAHFCVCPGTLYADRVIVQSEKIRNTYIREFRAFERKNQCAGRFGKCEEKFAALGSPKIDKVLSLDNESYELPESWRKIAERQDGTRKTLILYNTTIDSLLNHREKFIERIQEVQELFRRRCEEITLLWRPHPLLEATIRSMLPHLWFAYEALAGKFSEEGWGIYDDSEDLYRAIALSDAYYGDWSSVVELYKLTGKPLMIQTFE